MNESFAIMPDFFLASGLPDLISRVSTFGDSPALIWGDTYWQSSSPFLKNPGT